MLEVPISANPAQIVKIVLAEQDCQITLQQKQQGLFADVSVDGVDVSFSALARDGVSIVPNNYAGFAGVLMFVDTMGNSDPSYEGLGTRYRLVYLTDAEYAVI